MSTFGHTASQVKKVERWLRANQIVLSEGTAFSFENIVAGFDQFDDFEIKGKLLFQTDNYAYREDFEITWDIVGRPRLQPFMYYSPLGVPASFTKYIMTDPLNQRISKWIEDNVPKIRPVSYYGPNEFKDRVISEDFYLQCESLKTRLN